MTGEIEIASCDLPLAAMLLRDAVTLTCALEPSTVAAAAAAGRPAASLELRLRLLHVGEAQQDDAMPGVPRDLAARRTADGSKRKQSAAAMQAAFRGRQARTYTSGLLAQARSMAQALVEETTAAAAAAAAAAGLLPSPPPIRTAGVGRVVARRRRRRRLHALLLSFALVVCVAVSLLLFYLSESAQCQLAGSPGECIALLLGLH